MLGVLVNSTQHHYFFSTHYYYKLGAPMVEFTHRYTNSKYQTITQTHPCVAGQPLGQMDVIEQQSCRPGDQHGVPNLNRSIAEGTDMSYSPPSNLPCR